MNIISIENASKSYGIKKLFESLSLHIIDTDKIGVIGINGTGKSSLLRILAGADAPDTGTVTPYISNIRIEYLSQDPDFNPEATVLQQVFHSDSPSLRVVREYEALLQKAEAQPENAVYQDQLIHLTEKMNHTNGWELESLVKTVLTKLGIKEFDAPMGTLSGGQKKRVALASALITPCDLLILDEPTNHMDNNTIDWLEDHLKSRKGALLMVTHDRYFLDRVVNRTIELDNGSLYSYAGNYSTFVEKRLERRALQSAMEQKRENLYRRELEWVRRGAQARTTKQKARLQRFDALEKTSYGLEDCEVEISLGGSRLGRKIMEAVSLNKSYGPRQLIRDFSYLFQKGDRIGIIGDNGRGKTTLLNILGGKIQPDSGHMELGPTVNITYIEQSTEAIPADIRAIEYIRETAEYITNADGERITASQMMERFLFDGDMQWTYVSKLSGGEKRRLYFLKMLMEAPNILIMDEPTNDLDIDTLTVLEEFIEGFNGVVIVVSHDRYFLDRVCNRIFSFEPTGDILIHTGNYSDYMGYRHYLNVAAETSKPNTALKSAPEKSNIPSEVPERKLKFTFKEQLEHQSIGTEIAALESELVRIEQAMQIHATDFVRLQDLSTERDETETRLLEKMERQEYLDRRFNEMKNSKGTQM